MRNEQKDEKSKGRNRGGVSEKVDSKSVATVRTVRTLLHLICIAHHIVVSNRELMATKGDAQKKLKDCKGIRCWQSKE